MNDLVHKIRHSQIKAEHTSEILRKFLSKSSTAQELAYEWQALEARVVELEELNSVLVNENTKLRGIIAAWAIRQ